MSFKICGRIRCYSMLNGGLTYFIGFVKQDQDHIKIPSHIWRYGIHKSSTRIIINLSPKIFNLGYISSFIVRSVFVTIFDVVALY